MTISSAHSPQSPRKVRNSASSRRRRPTTPNRETPAQAQSSSITAPSRASPVSSGSSTSTDLPPRDLRAEGRPWPDCAATRRPDPFPAGAPLPVLRRGVQRDVDRRPGGGRVPRASRPTARTQATVARSGSTGSIRRARSGSSTRGRMPCPALGALHDLADSSIHSEQAYRGLKRRARYVPVVRARSGYWG